MIRPGKEFDSERFRGMPRHTRSTCLLHFQIPDGPSDSEQDEDDERLMGRKPKAKTKDLRQRPDEKTPSPRELGHIVPTSSD
jgi:hypothetical protein